MIDVFAVAKIVTDRIQADYPQDVALVGYYGSYAQGRATERSDLDFFFIPATPRGREVELQFIIAGISFDFWPIAWERAERMAEFEEWNTTIIADCELLYVRSEADRDRFMQLRETIRAMSGTANAGVLLRKAEAALQAGLLGIGRLELAGLPMELSVCRIQAHEIVVSLFKSLALLNQTFYTQGWGYYREQLAAFVYKPAHADQCLETIMTSRSPAQIIAACKQLLNETRQIIAERKRSEHRARSYKDRLRGYYEEEKGMLNKLLTACDEGHYEKAFFAATSIQDQLARILCFCETGNWPANLGGKDEQLMYARMGFPDLAVLLDPSDYNPLRSAVLQLEELLLKIMQAEEVQLNQFESIDAFERYYTSKR